MFDEFSLTPSPPGHLLAPCDNLRIFDAGEGRKFVALEMAAGQLYTARLGDYPEQGGSPRCPRRVAIYDEAGAFLAGASSAEHCGDSDSLCSFIPTRDGTHYIEARGCGYSLGSPEPDASDGGFANSPLMRDPHDVRAQAGDLGDIAGVRESLFPVARFHGNAEPLGFVRFSLTEPRLVSFGLRFSRGGAALFLEDAGGMPLCGRTHRGSTEAWLSAKLEPGAYYARVSMPARDAEPCVLRYKAAPASGAIVQALRRHAGQSHDPAVRRTRGNGANAPSGRLDGPAARVSLGTVPSPDWMGPDVRHRLVGSNESGLFELDALTGELFFNGTEADVAPGKTEYVLKVRFEDGDRSGVRSTTVSANSAPSPGEGLPGERARVPLGPLGPPGPLGQALRYRLTGGNESGLFELDEATGELFFNGTAEELDEAENGFRLTVKLDAGRH